MSRGLTSQQVITAGGIELVLPKRFLLLQSLSLCQYLYLLLARSPEREEPLPVAAPKRRFAQQVEARQRQVLLQARFEKRVRQREERERRQQARIARQQLEQQRVRRERPGVECRLSEPGVCVREEREQIYQQGHD